MDENIEVETAELVEQAAELKFIVYTKSTIACPYCARAKQFLTDRGYGFIERDIAEPETMAELLKKRPTARTVPQIFLMNDYHIGGCDDLMRLQYEIDTLIELNS